MNIKKSNLIITIWFIIFGIGLRVALAEDDLRFGPEFTFTNPKILAFSMLHSGNIVNNYGNEQGRDNMMKKIKEKCPECTITQEEDRYKVKRYRVEHAASGIWFNISVDPAVVEIQMKPLTLTEIKDNKELIDGLIFKSASEAKMNPYSIAGGGHIHIGYKEKFEKNPLLFRNFLVDFQNHPEIWNAIFANNQGDFNNAPTISLLGRDAFKKYQKIIADFDQSQGKMGVGVGVGVGVKVSVKEMLQRLVKEVFVKNNFGNPSEKYQALNISRILGSQFGVNEKTAEIRSFTAQKSIDDYIDQTEMLSSRIAYLEKMNRPIAVVDKTLLQYSLYVPVLSGGRAYRLIYNPKKVVNSFQQYLAESGLPFERYKKFLPGFLKWITPDNQCPVEYKGKENGSALSTLTDLAIQMNERL